MKYCFFAAAFCFFLILGCSNELVTNPALKELSSKKGTLSLKINKSNVPSDVVTVEMTLSRQNFDEIKAELNLLSDSEAEIYLDSIPVGSWHLRIEAKDSLDKVLYEGETEVEIKEFVIANVNLTLSPVGDGIGGVSITVNWDKNLWIDYYKNPVFNPYQNPTFPIGVSGCKILFDNGKYKMWYTSLYSSSRADIWYAESKDGIKWKSVGDGPVLTKGSPGSWDDYRVGIGGILKDENTFKMYYTGWQDQYSAWQIGLAVSQDGINWEKHSSPLLNVDSSEFQMGVTDVIKHNNNYYMFYGSKDIQMNNYQMRLATSKDGINWVRYSGGPILLADQPWENNEVLYSTVIFDKNRFVMVYSNGSRTAFGIATSLDGLNWEKKSNNPVFSVSDVHDNWTNYINYPFLRKFNNEYRLYYTGGSSDLQIGVVIIAGTF